MTATQRMAILHALTAIPLMVLTLLSYGCQPHKEIECSENMLRKINLRFDWEDLPQAHPEGMTVYFFPTENDGRIWRFDIAGQTGGQVELSPGTYRMLAFNNDTHNVRFTDTGHYDLFGATTPGITSLQNESAATPPLRTMPENIYAGCIDNLDITICGVRYSEPSSPEGKTVECGKSIVKCPMNYRTCIYTVIIRNVKNSDRTVSIAGSLSGLAGGITLANGDLQPPDVTEPFPMAVHKPQTITGSLTCFGHIESDTNILTVTAKLNDGTTVNARRDVTEQIVNSPDPHNVTIVIDGLEIPDGETPKPPIGEGDLDVGVDGWTVIIIDINTEN